MANFWSGNATSCEKEEREMESGLGEPTTTDFCICFAALPDARISQQIALLTKWGRKRTQITINEVDRARFPSRSPIQQGGATVLKQVAIMTFMAHIRRTELVAEKLPHPISRLSLIA